MKMAKKPVFQGSFLILIWKCGSLCCIKTISMKEAPEEVCTRPRAFPRHGVLLIGVVELDPSTFLKPVHCALLAYLSEPLRCDKDIEVLTHIRLLQEGSQIRGKPLLWLSSQSPRKVSRGRWSLTFVNPSYPAVTDTEHMCGVHASGVTQPVGLVCCGTFWLFSCPSCITHSVLRAQHTSTVVPESHCSQSRPPENCLATLRDRAALGIVGSRAGAWLNSPWTYAWTLCSVQHHPRRKLKLPACPWPAPCLRWLYCSPSAWQSLINTYHIPRPVAPTT